MQVAAPSHLLHLPPTHVRRPTWPQSVLLEIFYPDSRGVNVFVGGAGEPDMALKLVGKLSGRRGVDIGCAVFFSSMLSHVGSPR